MEEEKRCRISREMLKHALSMLKYNMRWNGVELEPDPKFIRGVANSMPGVLLEDVKRFWLELAIEMVREKMQEKDQKRLQLEQTIELAQAKLKELEEE